MAETAMSVLTFAVKRVLQWMDDKEDLQKEVVHFQEYLKNMNLALGVLKSGKQEDQLHPDLVQLFRNLDIMVCMGFKHSEKAAQEQKKWISRPQKHLKKLAHINRRLEGLLPILTMALAGTTAIASSSAKPQSRAFQEKALQKIDPSMFISKEGALRFWKKFFENNMEASNHDLLKALEGLYRLTNDEQEVVLKWVDEDKNGTCTISEFSEFVDTFGSLTRAMKMVKGHYEPEVGDSKASVLFVAASLKDHQLARAAQDEGIIIEIVPTCAAALDFLEENEHLLGKKSKFRIVTNKVNYDGKYMVDKSAGGAAKALINFVKKRKSPVAILVYCNRALPIAAEFAKKEKRVYATNDPGTAKDFIRMRDLPLEKVTRMKFPDF